MKREVPKKRWYESKTLWVNFLSIVALIVHDLTGVDWFDAETQVILLGVINIILRAITKKELVFTDPNKEGGL